MSLIRPTSAALASVLTAGVLVAGAPLSARADHEPCHKQQAKVEKATAKLEALTAKFAAHPTKKVKRAKKAQVQRVSRTTTRLDACLAAAAS